MVEAAEASGETVSGFCRRYDIHRSHFYYWRRRLRAEEDRSARSGAGGEFVLAGTSGMGAESEAALELAVGRGWRLRIGGAVEERALRVVLAALAAQS